MKILEISASCVFNVFRDKSRRPQFKIPRVVLQFFIVTLVAFSAVSSHAQVCLASNPSAIPNTYYPVVSNPTSTTVNIGPARVASNASTTALAAGDLAFIIQMQDASIDNSNTSNFGNGSTGTGVTSQGNTGLYEFRRVLSVAAGLVTFTPALTNTYVTAAATPTAGQRRAQVLRVPEFVSLSLGNKDDYSPPDWNGSTGGVFVLNVAGTLTLSKFQLNAAGIGFRGGGALQTLSRTGGLVVDYATSLGAGTPPDNSASKGEGIAGSPRYVANRAVSPYASTDLATSGYPASTDFSRGAPGNAGGGGTQHNAGGGGGANGGAGGKGGGSYSQYSATNTGTCVLLPAYPTGGINYFGCGGDGARQVGGLGGSAVNTATSARMFMGGGGGAGDSNNSTDNPGVAQNSGGNGGGAVFIRANSIVAAQSSITVNGQSGLPGGRDAAGGGGAGGSIYISTTIATSQLGLDLSADGGDGANTGYNLRAGETQGPGGGGGGGVVAITTTATFGTVSQAFGIAGTNSPAANAVSRFGAADGVVGVNAVLPTSTPPACGLPAPELTLAKTANPASFVVGTPASYTLSVQNTGTAAATPGATVTDTIPTGLTIGTLPSGCVRSGQVVTCTITTGLAVGATTSFIIPVTPTLAAANPVVNTANVSGGGDAGCPGAQRCSSTTTTPVSAADMSVAITGLPLTAGPGAVLNGNVVCTNIAATAAATNPTCNFAAGTPTGATVAATGTCVYSLGGSNASVPAGGTITCPITVTMPGTNGGADPTQTSVGVNATTSAGNDGNTTNNAASVTINVIDALNDSVTTPFGTAGTVNVLGNDQNGPNPATTSNVTIAQTSTPTAGSTFSVTTGAFIVPATATAGTYTVNYQICSTTTSTACDTATATIVVGAPADMSVAITGLPLTAGPGASFNGNVVCTNIAATTAATNPTCSFAAGTPTGATVATNGACTYSGAGTSSSVPAGATITCPITVTMPGTNGGTNLTQTSVGVNGTTSAGNDGNTANNATNFVINVIDALDDSVTTPFGTAGTVNVLGNDQNGANPATTSNVTLTQTSTPTAGSTFSVTTGAFSVPATATAGTYTVNYQICSTTTSTACDTATATIVVGAASDMNVVINGLPLTAGPGASFNGNVVCTNIAATTAATNPTCNFAAGTPTGATVVLNGSCSFSGAGSSSSVPAGGTITCPIIVTMPGTNGGTDVMQTSVGVNAATTATNDGNTANNAASFTINVIDAVNDNFGPINSSSGGSTTSVLANDQVGTATADGAPTTGNVLLAANGAQGFTGTGTATPLTLNTSTGVITVPTNATPGTYTVPYRICSVPAASPAACDDGVATIVVSGTPSLSVTKTAGAPSVGAGADPNKTDAGDSISYSFVVRNTGDVALTNVNISDPKLPQLLCATIGTLAVGATQSVTCTSGDFYILTAADIAAGSTFNVATATGTAPPNTCGAEFCSITARSTSTVPTETNGGITVIKLANPGVFTAAGNVISYTILVDNTGTTALTSVNVVDPKAGTVTCPGGNPIATLAVGATIACTASYTITAADVTAGSMTNVARATGTAPANSCATPPCTVSGTGANTVVPPSNAPQLTVAKQASPKTVSTAGQIIDYVIVGTNTGNVTLTNVSISDNKVSALSCVPAAPATLAVGATITCTGAYTLTAGDAAAGSVTNIATGTATPPNGPALTATGTATTPVVPVAVDDFDSTTLNVPVTTPLSGNDQYPAGSTVITSGTSSAPGGTVTCTTPTATPASCTYQPPAGFVGSDTYTYTLCMPNRNEGQSVCDTAIVTITVAASDMSVAISGLPANAGPGSVLNGTLTCTNTSTATPAIAATCAAQASPTLPGATVVVGQCQINGANVTLPTTVGTAAPNNAIVCPLMVTLPANPTDSNVVPMQVAVNASTSAANDNNTANNTASFTINVVDAVNDSASVAFGSAGSVNVLGNDTVGTNPAVTGGTPNVAITVVTGGGPTSGSTFDTATGAFSVPAGAAPGTYTVTYQICSTTTSTACDTATATIVIGAAADMSVAITGLPLTAGPGAAFLGNVVCTNIAATTAATNPTCNFAAGTPTGATVAATGACVYSSGGTTASVPAGGTITCPIIVTMPGTNGGTDLMQSSVGVNGTTSAGNDGNTANNAANFVINVIDALDDSVTTPFGTAGTVNVLSNDQNGASPATTSNVTIAQTSTPTANSTFNVTTGDFSVPATAAAGTYTVTYRICSTTTPAACDIATATIVVGAASDMSVAITGLPLTAGPGAVFNGNVVCTNLAATTAATNPTCSFAAGTPTGATVAANGACAYSSGGSTESVPAGGTITCPIVVTMPGTNGGADLTQTSVGVNATTSGSNDGNTANNAANFVINVIDALDDSVNMPFGTAGSLNVLGNDAVGASPAVTGGTPNVVITVLPGGPTAGSTFDTATGVFSVPAGAAPGTYTVTYQICSTATPAACDTAVATLTVDNARTISGNVFNDLNGQVDNQVNGTGTGGGLTAYLVNPITGAVIASAVVSPTGSYVFPLVADGTYNIVLSATPGQTSNPTSNLPPGWVHTGESSVPVGTSPNDGVIMGVVVAGAGVSGLNFGIQQPPLGQNNTDINRPNPGGTTSVTVTSTTFTNGTSDPSGGTITGYLISFPTGADSITVNGTTYTSTTFTAAFPSGSVFVPVANIRTIAVDPAGAGTGPASVVIPFRPVDNASIASVATYTATVPFGTGSTVSGTVFNDGNGLTDSAINGTGSNAGGLTAYLVNVNTGVVVASAPVAANGAYSLLNVANGTYAVVISATAGQTSNPTTNLPANWVTTGEGVSAAGDGLPDGRVTPVVVNNASVGGVNFGIQQRPIAGGSTLASQTNPGGTVSVPVPASVFQTGSNDADGVIASYTITAFPTNATSITIGGVTYTATGGNGTTAFPAAGVVVLAANIGAISVDPMDGTVTVVIPFTVTDNAGATSTAAGSASVPFTFGGIGALPPTAAPEPIPMTPWWMLALGLALLASRSGLRKPSRQRA